MTAATGGPLVDVGIPTRGTPRYLAEAVESVLAQTLAEWRLVISENGPGGSEVAALVRPYLADPRVELAATGADLGMAHNHTALLRAGTAPYVAILHDDDLWEPGFLERRVSFLEAHPDCAFVFSDVAIVDGDGTVRGVTAVPLRRGVHRPEEFLPRLYAANLVSVPSILVRRAAYAAVGGEFNPDVAFIDYEMWLRLAATAPVGFLPGADARYRIHPGQASSTARLELGARRLAVLEAVTLPPSVPARVRREARADALLQCAFDAFERGERRDAARFGRAALRAHPRPLRRAPFLARAASLALALPFGEAGRRRVAAVRERRFSAHGARAKHP
jgi:GT2 family glycosyltransferase